MHHQSIIAVQQGASADGRRSSCPYPAIAKKPQTPGIASSALLVWHSCPFLAVVLEHLANDGGDAGAASQLASTGGRHVPQILPQLLGKIDAVGHVPNIVLPCPGLAGGRRRWLWTRLMNG